MGIEFKISKDELIDFNMKYIVGTKTHKEEIRAYAIFAHTRNIILAFE